jgi:leucyl aminopeptidase
MSTYIAVKERVRQQLVQDAKDCQLITVHPVSKDTNLDSHAAGAAATSWARVNSFKAKHGEVLVVPDQSGGLGCVMLGLGEAKPAETIWAYAALPGKLPAGTYSLAAGAPNPDQALLGWVLGKQQKYGL